MPKRRTLVYSLRVNKFGLNLAMALVVGGAVAEIVTPRLSAMKSPLGGIGLSLLLPGFILWTIARFQLEAQVLEARFGDAYRAYRASTWF